MKLIAIIVSFLPLFLFAQESPQSYVRTMAYLPNLEQPGAFDVSLAAGGDHFEFSNAVRFCGNLSISGQIYSGVNGEVRDVALGYHRKLGSAIRVRGALGIGNGRLVGSRSIIDRERVLGIVISQTVTSKWKYDINYDHAFIGGSCGFISNDGRLEMGMFMQHYEIRYHSYSLVQTIAMGNEVSGPEYESILDSRRPFMRDIGWYMNVYWKEFHLFSSIGGSSHTLSKTEYFNDSFYNLGVGLRFGLNLKRAKVTEELE